MRKQSKHANFELNGLSISSMSLNQEGELEVEFDLPQDQTTPKWYTSRQGSRSFDVYEDKELEDACRRVFQVVRKRVMEPDEDVLAVHCDNCETSDCCRKYNVLLRETDVERLSKSLGMSPADFESEYTDAAVDWCGDFARQLACDEDDEGEEKCVFLKEDAEGRWRCSVYEHRPQICRDYDMKTCDDFVAIEDITIRTNASSR